jgi:hypothetical protein
MHCNPSTHAKTASKNGHESATAMLSLSSSSRARTASKYGHESATAMLCWVHVTTHTPGTRLQLLSQVAKQSASPSTAAKAWPERHECPMQYQSALGIT